MPNNTCAEETIKKAFELVLSKQIGFNQALALNDIQIDFNPVFLVHEGISTLFFTGHNQIDLAKSIATLDKSKSYFLRTGIIGGAGHWQLMYFAKNLSHWLVFSSETSNYSCTYPDGSLTDTAIGALIVSNSRYGWGNNVGQYAISLQEATPDRVKAVANFIADVRCSTSDPLDDQALLNLYAPPDSPMQTTTNYFFEIEGAPTKAPNFIANAAPPLLKTENPFKVQKIPIETPIFFDKLKIRLSAIDAKATDLSERKFIKEAAVARTLCKNIRAEIKLYLSSPRVGEAIAIKLFKKNCLEHIDIARPTLEKHRGWTQVLGNLGLFIAGLGVGYLVAGLINLAMTKKFLFFETDSSNKLHQLADEVKHTNPVL